MSLTVTPELTREAESGHVSLTSFIDCVRASLPYAYGIVESLAQRFHAGEEGLIDDNRTPASQEEWGQLFRAMASDPIRCALEKHFGVRLAFQNCHRVAVFDLDGSDDETYRYFTSFEAQVLAQEPHLLDC